MSDQSAIQWTDATWNPVTGCTKVSAGCANCYAERVAERMRAAGVKKYANGFKVTLHPDALQLPLRWKRPRRIFVNSMSDLFHPDVPAAFIVECFEVMAACPQHTFQILTKRPERVESVLYGEEGRWFLGGNDWDQNIWVGFSAENQITFDARWRVFGSWAYAMNLFVSLEPLLGPISVFFEHDTARLRWVIVGGESGPGHRPMQPEWVTSIRDQCVAANVPFFFKQWGGNTPKTNGRGLDGRIWSDMPRSQADGGE